MEHVHKKLQLASTMSAPPRGELMQQLAITVPLRSGETLTSYISHLAVANGIISALEICKDVGLSLSALRQGQKEQLFRLSELSGVPTEALRNAANIPTGSLDYCPSSGFLAPSAA